MDKKHTTLLLLFTILFSCAPVKYGQYRVKLESVDISGTKTSDVIEIDRKSDIYRFEDDFINIAWQVREKDFTLKLLNKCEKSIKIIWDDAVYVDIHGVSNCVVHKGVKYINISEYQTSSTIAKNTFFDDVLIPTNNINYSFTSTYSSGWKESPLFPITGETREDTNRLAMTYMGKEIKIVLPIKIGEETKEYTFCFRIKEFIPN